MSVQIAIHLPTMPRDDIAAKLKEYGVGAVVCNDLGQFGVVASNTLLLDDYPYAVKWERASGALSPKYKLTDRFLYNEASVTSRR